MKTFTRLSFGEALAIGLLGLSLTLGSIIAFGDETISDPRLTKEEFESWVRPVPALQNRYLESTLFARNNANQILAYFQFPKVDGCTIAARSTGSRYSIEFVITAAAKTPTKRGIFGLSRNQDSEVGGKPIDDCRAKFAKAVKESKFVNGSTLLVDTDTYNGTESFDLKVVTQHGMSSVEGFEDPAMGSVIQTYKFSGQKAVALRKEVSETLSAACVTCSTKPATPSDLASRIADVERVLSKVHGTSLANDDLAKQLAAKAEELKKARETAERTISEQRQALADAEQAKKDLSQATTLEALDSAQARLEHAGLLTDDLRKTCNSKRAEMELEELKTAKSDNAEETTRKLIEWARRTPIQRDKRGNVSGKNKYVDMIRKNLTNWLNEVRNESEFDQINGAIALIEKEKSVLGKFADEMPAKRAILAREFAEAEDVSAAVRFDKIIEVAMESRKRAKDFVPALGVIADNLSDEDGASVTELIEKLVEFAKDAKLLNNDVRRVATKLGKYAVDNLEESELDHLKHSMAKVGKSKYQGDPAALVLAMIAKSEQKSGRKRTLDSHNQAEQTLQMASNLKKGDDTQMAINGFMRDNSIARMQTILNNPNTLWAAPQYYYELMGNGYYAGTLQNDLYQAQYARMEACGGGMGPSGMPGPDAGTDMAACAAATQNYNSLQSAFSYMTSYPQSYQTAMQQYQQQMAAGYQRQMMPGMQNGLQGGPGAGSVFDMFNMNFGANGARAL